MWENYLLAVAVILEFQIPDNPRQSCYDESGDFEFFTLSDFISPPTFY